MFNLGISTCFVLFAHFSKFCFLLAFFSHNVFKLRVNVRAIFQIYATLVEGGIDFWEWIGQTRICTGLHLFQTHLDFTLGTVNQLHIFFTQIHTNFIICKKKYENTAFISKDLTLVK